MWDEYPQYKELIDTAIGVFRLVDAIHPPKTNECPLKRELFQYRAYTSTPTIGNFRGHSLGFQGSNHMCQGLNSHYFHIIGDGHQPNGRRLYTHYKDSGFLLKGGMTIPNIVTFDHGTYIINPDPSIWSNYSDLTRPGPPKGSWGSKTPEKPPRPFAASAVRRFFAPHRCLLEDMSHEHRWEVCRWIAAALMFVSWFNKNNPWMKV